MKRVQLRHADPAAAAGFYWIVRIAIYLYGRVCVCSPCLRDSHTADDDDDESELVHIFVICVCVQDDGCI